MLPNGFRFGRQTMRSLVLGHKRMGVPCESEGTDLVKNANCWLSLAIAMDTFESVGYIPVCQAHGGVSHPWHTLPIANNALLCARDPP